MSDATVRIERPRVRCPWRGGLRYLRRSGTAHECEPGARPNRYAGDYAMGLFSMMQPFFSQHELAQLIGPATQTVHEMGDGERLTFGCRRPAGIRDETCPLVAAACK